MTRPPLPFAPLAEAVFEIRFPGDLELYSKWGSIQRDLRERYGTLMVPLALEGQAPALQAFKLGTADQHERVSLAVNSFAYSIAERYKLYVDFRAEFERVFAVFRRHYLPTKINRAGLRYINFLPPEFPGAPSAAGQVHPCLKLRVEGLARPLVASQVMSRFDADGHTLQLALVQDQKSFRLDFDCFRERDVDQEQLLAVMDKAHELIDATFFDLVTPEYLRYMEGKGA